MQDPTSEAEYEDPGHGERTAGRGCRWSAAVRETVVAFGTGGVGVNAVQGARHAGAKRVWREGHTKLTELITKKYTLDEINEDYADLMNGKNIRGVIAGQH
jgi:Zn-dependent alcohol dehydrogenase